MVRRAIDDLVERTGVDAQAVTVVSVDEVTWRTASLGCPQRGFQYAQVLTPGVRIVLEADGVAHSYHAGAGRGPFFCADPEAPQDAGSGSAAGST